MKRCLQIILFILFLCSKNTAGAQSHSLYDELVSVNAEWKYQPEANNQLKTMAAKPLTEQQLVQFHLSETEKLLRSRNVANLSLQQIENRQKNLDVLHQYMLAGKYPVNNMHMNRQPYFIDENNTYCAVGYLMKESGADSMARYINRTQNFSYLKDITHKDLMTWTEQSGLTIDELALIQPGYPGDAPPTLLEFHYNNAGNDINEYFEIRQGIGLGLGHFNKIFFYNRSGLVYKSLSIEEMTPVPGYPVYYYQFSQSDSFANAGMIEIRYQEQNFNGLLSSISYNSDSVTITNYYGSYIGSYQVYHVGENESTPVNTSLTFCGHYPDTWNLSSQATTIGTVNSCVVFPVTFGNFAYTFSQNKVTLNWQTLTETNNKYFGVERSTDGISFTEIGRISAAGNGTAGSQYKYTDNNPQYINYYRLKQVDRDGTSTYSKILYVKVETASKLVLQQTLVNNELIYQNTSSKDKSTIDIYDLSGKRMYSSVAGNGTQHINVSSFAAGKYFMRLTTANGEVYTKQFMKQ